MATVWPPLLVRSNGSSIATTVVGPTWDREAFGLNALDPHYWRAQRRRQLHGMF